MKWPPSSRHSLALYGEPSEPEVISAINTTPLVDVMLVLLIIFLITVPVATASMSVALPQESTQLRQVVPKTLHVSVDRQGRLFLAQTPVKDGSDLTRQLQAMNDPDRPIHLVADKDASYGQIEPALRALRSAGMRQVSFVTEPVTP